MSVSPVGAVLSRGVDWHEIIEGLARGNAAMDAMRRVTHGEVHRGTYHWETWTAPSIQLVELKYIPWWCRVVGASSEFVT